MSQMCNNIDEDSNLASPSLMAEDEADASPAPALTEEDAHELMRQGKADLLHGNVQEAIEALSTCCAVISNTYGDLSLECASPYYWYGCALFEAAKALSTPFGVKINEKVQTNEPGCEIGSSGKLTSGIKAIMGEEQSESPSRDIEVSESPVSESEPGNVSAAIAPPTEKTDNRFHPETKGFEPGSVSRIPGALSSVGTNEGAGNSGSSEGEARQSSCANDANGEDPEEEDEGDEETEDSYISDAWDCLDSARAAIASSGSQDRTHQILLADVYMKLGEIHAENGFSEKADVEFENSLAILRTLEPKERRVLGEKYYLAGAYSLDSLKFEKSIEYFKMAISDLKDELVHLKEACENEENEAIKKKLVQDCEELEEVIGIVEERKVEATLSIEQKSQKEKLCETSKTLQPNMSTSAASNINHLVKRKQAAPRSLPKPTDKEEDQASPEKKPKAN